VIRGLHEATQYGLSKTPAEIGSKATITVVVAYTYNNYLLKKGDWQPDKVRVCPYEKEGIIKILGHVKIVAKRLRAY